MKKLVKCGFDKYIDPNEISAISIECNCYGATLYYIYLKNSKNFITTDIHQGERLVKYLMENVEFVDLT